MVTSDNKTRCSPTAPGPPLRFGHGGDRSHCRPWSDSTDCEFVPASNAVATEAGEEPDVLDLYDEQAYRQAWEDAVHLKEIEIELKKAQQRVVAGVDNEDLEALLRAFDKVSR